MTPGGLARLFVGTALLTLMALRAWGATTPEDLRAAQIVCVPPGLPPYATWTPGDPFKKPLLLEDALHRPYAVLTRAYEAAGKSIHTWWLNGAMAMVDPDPKTLEEIGWIDDGLLQPDSLPRGADARPSCHWIRPLIPEPEQEPHDRT